MTAFGIEFTASGVVTTAEEIGGTNETVDHTATVDQGGQ